MRYKVVWTDRYRTTNAAAVLTLHDSCLPDLKIELQCYITWSCVESTVPDTRSTHHGGGLTPHECRQTLVSMFHPSPLGATITWIISAGFDKHQAVRACDQPLREPHFIHQHTLNSARTRAIFCLPLDTWMCDNVACSFVLSPKQKVPEHSAPKPTWPPNR